MIRQWLRRWLGVADERVLEAKIKGDVVRALANVPLETITDAIDRAVAKRQETEIVRHIKSESFIDEVVERIRRKQV